MGKRNGNVEDLRRQLEVASNIVLFTGAGISTESGIPDFRSPGGIWTTNQPIMFEDFVSSANIRKEAWRRKISLERAFKEAAPNRGHRAVARLVTDGKAGAVITQNIDNLHQVSGVPSERVVELHGNGTYATCLDCGRRYELAPILASFEEDETLPVCRGCEGIVKTATISFGQPMPVDAMQRAQEITLACDLFIAIGSSLVVYPAAGFLAMAKQNGAALVILNREPTGLDSIADLVLNEEIGETLGEAVGVD